MENGSPSPEGKIFPLPDEAADREEILKLDRVLTICPDGFIYQGIDNGVNF